jgi:DNA polymerase III delta prime subunit
METVNLNHILNRENDVSSIKEILTQFEKNKHNLTTKKGVYIYGDPGTGKTTFVMNVLKEMDYDIIKYDAGDIRNKSIIDTITKHNMSDRNIMSLFHKKIKRIAIVMDEIDGMNNGDKGGINSLIKIIRPKKTKKQKLEEITLNPIICIGNYHIDKKIKELMKVCHVIELKSPTKLQMSSLIHSMIPSINSLEKEKIIHFIQGDLRKLKTVYDIYENMNTNSNTNTNSNSKLSENQNQNQNQKHFINVDTIHSIFQMKSYNEDTRKITKKLINESFSMDEHLHIMNETDRTIVGLLWHENIVDVLMKMKKEEAIPFYLEILNNMCFADYTDRITFQKQIWQFNEMSSLIKTFKNNKLFHETFKKIPKYNPSEVRFTKVLTKYSTEYNNYIFIQDLCQQLGMDKKDLFSFFLDLKNKHDDHQIISLFENYEITKLDINRIYRYLEKYTKENAHDIDDDKSIDLSDD